VSVGGWQGWVDDGGVAGSAGVAFEGLEVHSNVGGQLRCTPYVSEAPPNSQGVIIHDGGWRAPVGDGALCGTAGEGRRVEGYTLQLVGGPPGESVSYRAYVSGLGWGPWVSDGAVAGVVGQGRAVQAIQVQTNPYT
jgi:Clostridial hydrophobic W